MLFVFYWGHSICLSLSYFMSRVFRLSCCLVVSTSGVDCLERLVFKMTYFVSNGTLNPKHSLVIGNVMLECK